MSLKFLSPALAAGLLFVSPVVAHAHGSMEPQHGGAVQMSGETMIEFLPSPQGFRVWVSEEDEPLPANAFDARATVTAADGTKKSYPMQAGAGNLLTAAGARAPSGAKVDIALRAKSNAAMSFGSFRVR